MGDAPVVAILLKTDERWTVVVLSVRDVVSVVGLARLMILNPVVAVNMLENDALIAIWIDPSQDG
jgi:hypothetical protein